MREADGTEATLSLVKPANVVVFEASGMQAQIETDGVNLVVYESDGSPANIALVPL